MRPIAFLMIVLALPHTLLADEEIPLLLPEERDAVNLQSDEFNQALAPALVKASESTVRVWSGTRRLAYGTVIGDGTRILSKWSEVARAKGKLQVDNGQESREVNLSGVYEDEDLVVLEIQGSALKPVVWAFDRPKVGEFLAAPQPDGKLAAFGVVSVLERNLRDTDMAYLGVIANPKYQGPGIQVDKVDAESGAGKAGLKSGDVILKVGQRTLSGLLELKNALTGVTPGQTLDLLVKAGGKEKQVKAVVGNRPKLAQFSGERLEQMERMGGPISQVRNSFTQAIQTDMRPKPNQIGGPVVNLKGEVLGITLARADRTRSFVMPAAAVEALLKKEAGNPANAQARDEAKEPRMANRGDVPPNARPRERAVPSEERMRRHLSDMQRLMEHLQEEMEALQQR
jgi:serine protease Do